MPFRFDVHAMIFSDDSPSLEAALHRTFTDCRLNLLNGRKEFFHVTLDEIEAVVKQYLDQTDECMRLAEASEYRQSIVFRQSSLARSPIAVDG